MSERGTQELVNHELPSGLRELRHGKALMHFAHETVIRNESLERTEIS